MPWDTEVYVREEGASLKVQITSPEKPEIDKDLIKKWQNIIDIMADILKVPSGLIMRINKDAIEVFVKSQNIENPYTVGGKEKLGKGLYCESVIGRNKELLVPNALKSEMWKDNPDVELSMISYYGLPLLWPDGEAFGTICVLDDKTNYYTETYINLIRSFRETIETDLSLLMEKEKLKHLSSYDFLTGVYNRRAVVKILEEEFNRCKRLNQVFSVIIIDIDNFKRINDEYGHEMGDKVLKEFASLISRNIRVIDSFGRWGGDEFILICPQVSQGQTKKLIRRLNEVIDKFNIEGINGIKCSMGYTEYRSADTNVDEIIRRADEAMYEAKENQ